MALNPIRVEPPLCPVPEAYAWSSYGALLGLAWALLGLASRPDWLTIDWVLGQFGGDYEGARLRLKVFVEEGVTAEPPRVVASVYFACGEFIRERTATLEPTPEIPRPYWQPLRPGLDEVFASEADPIAVAYRTHGYTLREIAAHLGCHYATVSRRLRRSERSV